jgi:hypothetical protein
MCWKIITIIEIGYNVFVHFNIKTKLINLMPMQCVMKSVRGVKII